MPDYALYCRLCWQEFDKIEDHNSGSWLMTMRGLKRLDGKCPGDIRPTENNHNRKPRTKKQVEALPLDAGDPLEVK